MHISLKSTNPKFDCYMNVKVLEESVLEKDLGVYVASNWKPSAHIAKIAAKANSMLGRIRHTFTFMKKQMFMKLYPSLVRTHMEYAVQAWSPQLNKDIILLEKVQQRATRLVPEIRELDYQSRLVSLGLMSLFERRRRGDLIEVFKIMHGFYDLDRSQFFTLKSEDHEQQTYGHSYCIFHKSFRNSIRGGFFDIRIIKDWNSLPRETDNRKTIGSFKKGTW